MFDTPGRLVLGLVTGIAFGFLLQKGHVTKHTVIARQLLLRDFTVVKVMATAVAVGAVGVYALHAAGLTALHIKAAQMGGILAGALLFGIGLALLGYCPGTTVAAAGEGNRDALPGLLGMFAGAALFVALYPQVQPLRTAIADLGKTTWPQWFGTSPWPWIAGLVTAIAILYAWNRRRGAPPSSGRSWWRHAAPRTSRP
jgi:uncharacterized membrane protein YedE/YeeE